VIPESVYRDRTEWGGVRWMIYWFQNDFMKWTTKKIKRYNRIAILLRTREGRCGEWANLFTAMMCSIGYHARLIVNPVDDHVWTEVYVCPMGWIHVDSTLLYPQCMNHPEVYLTSMYHTMKQVLAFSPAGVEDVTRKYGIQV